MRKNRWAVVAVLLSIVLISGCAHISAGVAPSNIPIAPGTYKELGEVTGIDCAYRLLGIIPISGANETKNALKNAISEASGANALINITADTYSQSYIIFGRTCTQVCGTAVIVNPKQ